MEEQIEVKTVETEEELIEEINKELTEDIPFGITEEELEESECEE